MERNSKRADAIAYFKRAIAIDADLPAAHIAVASPLLKQGNADEARASLERGAELAIEKKDAQMGNAALTNLRKDFLEANLT